MNFLMIIRACSLLLLIDFVNSYKNRRHEFEFIEDGLRFLRLKSVKTSDLFVQIKIEECVQNIYNLIQKIKYTLQTSQDYCVYSEYFLNKVVKFKASKKQELISSKQLTQQESSSLIVEFTNTIYDFTHYKVHRPVKNNTREPLSETSNLIENITDSLQTNQKSCNYLEHFLNKILNFKSQKSKTKKQLPETSKTLQYSSFKVIHFINTIYNFTKTAKTTSVQNKPSEPKIIEPSNPIAKPLECIKKKQIDCYDFFKLGYSRDTILSIKPRTKPDCVNVHVSCNMKMGGQTVIMRRSSPLVTFYRNWNQYKVGFGLPNNDHWIGNDMIHYLTTQVNCSLRIDMEDWQGNKKFAVYEKFLVKSEDEGYELVVSGFSPLSSVGDSLSKHNGARFSTYDFDNDQAPLNIWNGNCAERFHGGWWYKACYQANLNGKYYDGGVVAEKMNDGIAWNSWHGLKYSLKFVEMRVFRNFRVYN